MKKSIYTMSGIAAVVMAVSSGNASAVVILTYGSNTTAAVGTAVTTGPQLVAEFNDSAFVGTFDATTSTDAATTSRTHLSQATANLGNTGGDLDIAFNFGGNTALGVASSTGPYIGTSFIAAQDLSLTEFTILIDPNNQNASNYGARDVTLFVSVDGGTTFTQFGTAIDNGGNGLTTNTFTDDVSVAAGQTVEFRAAFGDKGFGSVNNLQSFTRVGDITISADAVVIPEPSSTALLGLGGLALILRRRK